MAKRPNPNPVAVSTRLYIIWETPVATEADPSPKAKPVAVVDTTHPNVALRHFFKSRFSVTTASPRDMINVHAAGITDIMSAGAEDDAE